MIAIVRRIRLCESGAIVFCSTALGSEFPLMAKLKFYKGMAKSSKRGRGQFGILCKISQTVNRF
jgi:hypothetical protein